MNLEKLKNICCISGFDVSSNQADKLLEEFGEIVKVMNKIKDWNDTAVYVSSPKTLADLREDKEAKTNFHISKGISAPRVVQEDD